MSKLIMPFYRIFLNGKEIDQVLYANINKVTVKNTHHGASMSSLDVNDPDFIFIEGTLFVDSTPIKIEYGYTDGKMSEVATFDGYVSVIDCDFSEKGEPKVIIHCMDKSHLMNREEKTRTWQNRKYSDVVTEIFRSYGFKVQVDDTGEVIESIEQKDQTDIAFITGLANKIESDEYITYIDKETAYFVKRRLSGDAKEKLVYRETPYTLNSFRPRINKESKKIKRMQYDINLDTLKVVPSSVNPQYKKLGGQQVKNASRK